MILNDGNSDDGNDSSDKIDHVDDDDLSICSYFDEKPT